VRLWDVATGHCVRYFTGHKGKVYVVIFTNCGRFLLSSGEDKKILFWDLAHGYLVAELSGHRATVYFLALSRDGVILASGGNDDCVMLWDVSKLLDDLEGEDVNSSQATSVK
jgi:guanine nucleotide-binding protein, putative